MNTDTYAAVQGSTRVDAGVFCKSIVRLVSGVVMFRGSAKQMRRLVKSKGGSWEGWFVYNTNTPVGGVI